MTAGRAVAGAGLQLESRAGLTTLGLASIFITHSKRQHNCNRHVDLLQLYAMQQVIGWIDDECDH